jgi:Protein of unknown function (DUF4238)
MGKHYVPQEYLRGFASSGERTHVWMFNSQDHQWSHAAIKQVAQEGDYYPPDVESRLAQEVESPGHAALAVLRRGEELSSVEREQLGYYIAVMVVRGPRKRRLGNEMAPSVLKSTVEELRANLEAVKEEHDSPRIRTLLEEAGRLENKYRADMPKTVQEQIDSPWPSNDVIAAVQGMTWRFLRVPPPLFLITGDSPAFYFDSYGLGTEHAELTFPIDKGLVLHGSHQGDVGATFYLHGTRPLVKEVNKRLASGAERFVFSPKKEDWIQTLALRTKPFFSHIEW